MRPHKARKRFGQNFLQDDLVITHIIAGIAPQPGEHLVEIGPGLGALTAPLLASGAHLDVVELDRDLIPRLKKQFTAFDNLSIHEADALQFDFSSLSTGEQLRVVGNLPYNISTPLLFHLFSQRHIVQDMHFMLQKEVVSRMIAKAGGGDYGRLSIMTQYYAEASCLMQVGREAFDPPPKVESAIIRLKPYSELPHQSVDHAYFERIVKQAFSMRRKTIHNALKGHVTAGQLEQAEITPSLRPEQLTVANYVDLSNTNK